MKGMTEKIFPAIAFGIAISSALIGRSEANPPLVTASIQTVNNGDLTCVVVGSCEQGGNSICTDFDGNLLHRYNEPSGTCMPYVLGIFVE